MASCAVEPPEPLSWQHDVSKIPGSVFTLCSIYIDVKIVDLVAGEPMIVMYVVLMGSFKRKK